LLFFPGLLLLTAVFPNKLQAVLTARAPDSRYFGEILDKGLKKLKNTENLLKIRQKRDMFSVVFLCPESRTGLAGSVPPGMQVKDSIKER
jgi:hypothetical protein